MHLERLQNIEKTAGIVNQRKRGRNPNITLLRSGRIPTRFLNLDEISCYSDAMEWLFANAGVKNTHTHTHTHTKKIIVLRFCDKTNQLIPVKKPRLVIISKKKKKTRTYCCAGPECENQISGKERQVHEPCQKSKKVREHEDNGDIICNWCT